MTNCNYSAGCCLINNILKETFLTQGSQRNCHKEHNVLYFKSVLFCVLSVFFVFLVFKYLKV